MGITDASRPGKFMRTWESASITGPGRACERQYEGREDVWEMRSFGRAG